MSETDDKTGTIGRITKPKKVYFGDDPGHPLYLEFMRNRISIHVIRPDGFYGDDLPVFQKIESKVERTVLGLWASEYSNQYASSPHVTVIMTLYFELSDDYEMILKDQLMIAKLSGG